MPHCSFSLVTNVCANDINRVRLIFPHWLRVFGKRIADLTIVLDRSLPVGRIATQQGNGNGSRHTKNLLEVEAILHAQMAMEPRMRIIEMPQGETRAVNTRKWFGPSGSNIDRCQAGTPIAGFIAAWQAGQERFVLRADCDMLFHEAGWLDAAIELLGSGGADMVEPPRHRPDRGDYKVTTRVALIDAPAFMRNILPLRPYRLDPIRRWHRRLQGLPPWLSLEQMLQKEREAGRLRYEVLPPELGQWLHVARNDEAGLPFMPVVAESVRQGRIPAAQRLAGWDFSVAAWPAGQA